jgi:hypothetical protein
MDREPILAAAGYHLGVNVIPADSVAARERVSQLLHDGVSGIVCCSSIYPVVTALLGKVCPVIILGQGAGNAMVASLQAGSGQSSVGSGERSVGSGQLTGSSSTGDLTTYSPATQQPSAPPAPIEAPKPMPAVPVAILEDAADTPSTCSGQAAATTVNAVEEPTPEPTSMEGTDPSAPVSVPPIPEPVPVDLVPDPAFVSPALTEQRPPLNPEAEAPEATLLPAVAEPVSPPSETM